MTEEEKEHTRYTIGKIAFERPESLDMLVNAVDYSMKVYQSVGYDDDTWFEKMRELKGIPNDEFNNKQLTQLLKFVKVYIEDDIMPNN